MVQESEIVMLIIGLGVLIFLLGNRQQLKRIPSGHFLLFAFHALLTGWVLTVLEGFFWGGLFNYLEHISYAVASFLLAVWCWKVVWRRGGAR
ncbi:MAG: hypothetical protein JRF69_11350 [Deltaproteobacteria bacterium]|nr:hypothetical protein [Deltaproteobacteria bacterium]